MFTFVIFLYTIEQVRNYVNNILKKIMWREIFLNENINANMGISTKNSWGIARVVHDLSKRLIKDGHEVTL